MPFKLLSNGAWLVPSIRPGQIIFGATICQSETHPIWMFCDDSFGVVNRTVEPVSQENKRALQILETESL